MPYKHFTLVFVLFMIYNSYGQKSYKFDFFCEYEHKHDESSEPFTYFTFTNSKDNSYMLTVYLKDEANFNMHFIDEKGIEAVSTISKEDFLEVEGIGLKCSLVGKYVNKEKNEYLDKYDFFQLNDTLIKNDTLKHYVMRAIDEKWAKRKKVGEKHIIIQKGTDFHLPNRFPGSTSYYEWVESKTLPNGIERQSFLITNKGEIVESTFLLQYASVKKFILIDEGCDYTIKNE